MATATAPSPDAEAPATALRGEFEQRDVAVFLVDESPLNPRQHVDDAKFASLTESVRERGIITPLILRIVGDRFTVAAGHRRLRAANKIGLKYVPARVKEMTDDEFFELLVIENDEREDVHPLDRARTYQQWMERGASADEIAAKLKRSRSFVYQCVQLLKLTEPLQKLFLEGEVTAGHAVELARLPAATQESFLASDEGNEAPLYDWEWEGATRKRTGVVSVRKLRRLIQERVHLDIGKAPWDLADAGLVVAAGACLACPKSSLGNPDLFPDLTAFNACADGECYRAKAQAFVAAKRMELLEDGRKVIELSDRYQSRTDGKKGKTASGPLLSGGWTEASKRERCDETVEGLIVESDRAERLGQLLWVCVAKVCKTHRRGDYWRAEAAPKKPAGKASPQEKAAAARADAERAKRERKAEVDKRTLVAVLDRVKTIDRALAFVLARFAACTFDGDEGADAIAKARFGFCLCAAELDKRKAKFTDRQVFELLVLSMLGDELSEYSGGGGASLAAAAAAVGVDVKAIDQAVAKERSASIASDGGEMKAAPAGKVDAKPVAKKPAKAAPKKPASKGKKR